MLVRIGSRGSPLALWQAHWVRDRLASDGHAVEIQIIKTSGDKLTTASLVQSGTKGLFIKEIEEALASGAIDLAVHSLKDLPTDQPAGLVVGAVPEREDARDALITRDGEAFAALGPGARIGTSSLRRQSQLKNLRPDLQVLPLRGNVDTRLKKLERGDCDAVALAAAGLARLGLADRVTQYFGVEELCPAVGQGALALEVREGDEATADAIRPLDHQPTHRAVRAERAVLRRLGGGCSVPIAAHAVPWSALGDSQLRLVAVVASPNGERLIRATAVGPEDDPERLGFGVAEELLRQGAEEILTAGIRN
jgi:hydroxymethylbilane synthase